MPEGVEEAVSAFERAIDPTPREPSTPARDQSGRFVTTEKPEPFLQIRMLEGDPETGDINDAGDDPRLRQREREIADGRFDERAHRETQSRSRQAPAQTEGEGGERRVQREDGEERSDAAADDGHARAETGEKDADANAAVDEEGEEGADEDLENAQFEITVDGEPQTVSLGELRDGYIRTATFHQRLNKVNEQRQAIDQETQRVSQLRDLFINGLTALDHDMRGMAIAEPDWDQEFAKDPAAAHQKHKKYQAYYAKLNQVQQQRVWALQNQREEQDRASAKYAIDQFTEFVHDHPKLIKDESSLQRVIGGMRKTALAEGFAEHEVAGVYDKRMLNVLLKAWLYDQGMAVKPQAQAALPGPRQALVPGSARPIGSAVRRNIDEAQKQLARTGKLDDATTFFQRLLR